MKYNDAFGNIKYTMANSGKADATSRGDMDTQTLLAHFPMLFHKNPKTVMVIGLASGITAGEVLYYPINQLDILEINDQVIAASDFFIPWNNNVLSDPKTNLIIQDARAHLQLTGQNYDVIISEPSNPWMAGLAALFTINFFDLAKDRLNNGGMFVQWMHSYQMDWKTFDLVGRTFAKVFPNSLLVVTDPSGNGIDALLIGFKDKGRLKLEYAKRKLTSIRKSKNVSLLKSRLLFRLVVSEDLPRFFGHGDINTDNHPRLEFVAPKLMYGDDVTISKNIQSKERISLGSEIRNITEKITANVDDQIDFAAFALSVYSPFRNMVDLSKATSWQKERFFKLVETYCTNNEIDFSIFNDEEDELFKRCLSIQIDVLRNKIDLLPDKLVAGTYLGNLYNLSGNAPEAISYYQEVLRNDPYSIKTHNNLGVALTRQGRLDEAIKHYSIVLRIDHEHTEAHNDMGIALARQGGFDEAINHFLEALRINPDYIKAHYNLGLSMAGQGRLDDAISHFSKALQINAEHLEAHYNLGVVLAKKGRFNDAAGHFSEVLRINPGYTKAHYSLGRAMLKQGRLDKAINHFSEAVRLNPEFAEAHNNLGVVLARRGRFEDAGVHFREALRIKPGLCSRKKQP